MEDPEGKFMGFVVSPWFAVWSFSLDLIYVTDREVMLHNNISTALSSRYFQGKHKPICIFKL